MRLLMQIISLSLLVTESYGVSTENFSSVRAPSSAPSLATQCDSVFSFESTKHEIRSQTLHSSIGLAKDPEHLVKLLELNGFEKDTARFFAAGLAAESKKGELTPLRQFFRTSVAQMLMDQNMDPQTKVKLFNEWDNFRRSGSMVKFLKGSDVNESLLVETVALMQSLLKHLPAEVTREMPPEFQLALSSLSSIPALLPLLKATLSSFKLSGEQSASVSSFLTDNLGNSPIAPLIENYLPGKGNDNFNQILGLAGGLFGKTLSDLLPKKETRDELSDKSLRSLRQLLWDLDFAVTYSGRNTSNTSNFSPNTKHPLQLSFSEGSDHRAPFILKAEGLKSTGNSTVKSQDSYNFQLTNEKSPFHLFVHDRSGRSTLFDLLASQLILTSLGMPEAQRVSSPDQVFAASSSKFHNHIVLHLNPEKLDAAGSVNWVKSIKEQILERPNDHHLILWDQSNLTFKSLATLIRVMESFNQESNEGRNNFSFFISWNEPLDIDASAAESIAEMANLYQIANPETSGSSKAVRELRILKKIEDHRQAQTDIEEW